MATYKTPGVYVEEISVLPASVAAVETAIPAFIGYTEKASKNGKPVDNTAVRISSMLEYREIFGGEPTERKYAVELDANNMPQSVTVVDSGNPEELHDGAPGTTTETFFLYDAVRMFYLNGGGDCYIVSVDKSSLDTIDSVPYVTNGALETGIDAIKKVDEPTLILFPDGVNLSAVDLGDTQVYALQQCALLQDRFGVFDVKETDGTLDADILNFRNYIGVNDLKYGAAYTPNIHASLGSEPSLNDIHLYNLTAPGTGAAVNYSVISSNPGAAAEYAQASADKSIIEDLLAPTIGVTAYGSWEEAFSSVPTLDVGTGAELDHYVSTCVALAERIARLVAPTAYTPVATDPDRLTSQKLSSKVNALIAPIGDPTAPPYGDVATVILELELLQLASAEATVPNVTVTGLGGIFNGVAHPWPVADGPVPKYNLGTATSTSEYEDMYGGAISEGDAVRTVRVQFRKRFESLMAIANSISSTVSDVLNTNEGILRSTDPIYARIIAAVKAEGLVMPPSGAVVGRYADTDRTRGVWKAPANVSLNSVVGLSRAIDNGEQESINVDVTGGKSVNAIRAFKGKGTLIWGARTLAGNDNEWRYVPVRRLFIMAEESIRKATEHVVFEPNDANTWNRTQAMIENFLTGLWRDGALAGAKPGEAFFVNVGLGKTMTQLDILEGRLIIEIGMAAVRPAEFIILRFMHKLQES